MLHLLHVIFASLVIVCYYAPVMGHAICMMTKMPGHPLPTPRNPDNSSQPDCADGFFCYGFDPWNSTTYPVFCPPSPECAMRRSIGDKCRQSMGMYEPRLCRSKYYCPRVLGPTGIRVMEGAYVVADPYPQELPCPEGYYCLKGTRTPHKCPHLSICKEGSEKVTYYGSFIPLVILLTILIVAIILYRFKLYKSNLPFNFDDSSLMDDLGHTISAGRMNEATVGGAQLVPLGRCISTCPEVHQSIMSRKLKVLSNGFKKARGENEPIRIEFKNVKLFAPVLIGKDDKDKAQGPNTDDTEERPGYRQVLKGCSGDLKPGHVTGILGPTGAGKSVLFKLLLGRIPDNWQMEGTLSVNGNDSLNVTRMYRPRMGFVPQTDITHRELTVAQNLNFAAQLRLSANWTQDEKAYFVAAVVDNMRLNKQMDIRIGDEENRGVSGGQRRRTSIGCELAAAPLALFLDEPTSGLDSSTALEVCNCLREIAKEASVTVAMVIHQPRQEIWEALDTVLFLTKGALTAYEGPQAMARNYFETVCGVSFPLDSNPADVIVDAIVADGKRLARLWVTNRASFTEENEEKENDVVMDKISPQLLSQSYNSASFMCQFLHVHHRSICKQLSNIQLLVVEIVINILCAVIISLSLRDVPLSVSSFKEYSLVQSSPFEVYYPQIFMYCAQSVSLSASTTAVGMFGPDLLLYFHEAASGCNRLAYFLGTISSFLFRTLCISFIVSTILHVLPGLYISFWVLVLINFLLIHNSYAIGIIITIFFEVKDASLVAAVGSTMFGCFSGFIQFPNVVKYFSFSFWYANVLADMFYEPTQNAFKMWLTDWGYFEDSRWMAIGILAGYAVMFYAIAFLCMILYNREKQR